MTLIRPIEEAGPGRAGTPKGKEPSRASAVVRQGANMNQKSNFPILLTGATGYIGGRLLHVLENAGHRVRCVTRRPEALQSCVGPTTEIVSGNVLDRKRA